MLAVRGAPRDQGRDQGEALAGPIRDRLKAARRELGWRTWRLAVRQSRDPARALGRFMPQQHERLEGIADGAGVSLAALAPLELAEHVELRPCGKGTVIEARVYFPPGGAVRLLRESAPDVGGFGSVELTAPHWAGALAGVNTRGLIAMALEGPPTRALVQDLLLRAPSLDAALEHVRRRAPYLGLDGALLLGDASGQNAVVELHAGDAALRSDTPEPGIAPPNLRIDASECSLVWLDPDGTVQRAEASDEPGG